MLAIVEETGKRSLLKDAENIIKYLNEMAARRYPVVMPNGRPTTNAIVVMERLKEGNTVVVCRQVIHIKTMEWRDDPKMEKFLRPSTLFGRTNFYTYLGEIPDEG